MSRSKDKKSPHLGKDYYYPGKTFTTIRGKVFPVECVCIKGETCKRCSVCPDEVPYKPELPTIHLNGHVLLFGDISYALRWVNAQPKKMRWKIHVSTNKLNRKVIVYQNKKYIQKIVAISENKNMWLFPLTLFTSFFAYRALIHALKYNNDKKSKRNEYSERTLNKALLVELILQEAKKTD